MIEDLLVRVQVARIPSLTATGEDIDALLAAFAPPPELEFPLSEDALRQGARERIESQRYFRVRFRQSVSEDEIRNYYETVYAPEAAERGLGFALEEVADVVEELALLEKIQRDAEEWAEGLREDGLDRGRIEIVE